MKKTYSTFQEWWDDSGIHMIGPDGDSEWLLEDWYELYEEIWDLGRYSGFDDGYQKGLEDAQYIDD